ncbi:MAG: hypothetical protein ABW068_15815, partial [Candidatus Thiodiazotropha sp.]
MNQQKRRWDLRFKYSVMFPAIAKLPRYTSYRLASLWGRVEMRRDSELAAQIAHQMQRALPGYDADVYRSWTAYFYALQQREMLDTWYYPGLQTAEQVGKFIEVENFEPVLAARRENRPMIFVGAHLGRFWMLGVTTAAYGFPTSALARDDENNNTWGLPQAEFEYRRLKLSRLRACYRGDFRCQPGKAKRRLVVPGSREAILETRRAVGA